MVKRINKACKYFPCHEVLEDCTFCYCPFYPCKDRRRGRYLYSKGKAIWSCERCTWIHKKKIVDEIFKLIRKSDIINHSFDNRPKGLNI